jgi:uncharacterized Rmd1/YagE family protein
VSEIRLGGHRSQSALRAGATDPRMSSPSKLLLTDRRATARAVLIGDRIDTTGLAYDRVLSTAPLAVQVGDGVATVFRYGAVVLTGLAAADEQQVLGKLASHVRGAFPHREEETASIELSDERDEQIPPGGPIYLKNLTVERVLIISEALAKSVVLARDEREVATVFDMIEPFARELAEQGRTPGGRRSMLRHIGNALLVQHRVSGRVAVTEKPDVLWDRPDLERLYSRLETEYELKERAEALDRKLNVIAETATALTDIIDTERSLRLEVIIVALLVVEIAIAAYQIFAHSFTR